MNNTTPPNNDPKSGLDSKSQGTLGDAAGNPKKQGGIPGIPYGAGNQKGKGQQYGLSKGLNRGPVKRSGPVAGGGQRRSGFGGARGR